MLYSLPDALVFPHPSLAGKGDGLLAIGGDLSVERLLLAYQFGIFPWYGEGEPILWWSPDPRLILLPEELYLSKSMRRLIRSGRFVWSLDRCFEEVMRQCAKVPRRGQGGSTWISPEMMDAYEALHRRGHAQSLEVWEDGKLVGGLYGVRIGRVFFGESMFHKSSNASKFALAMLAQHAGDLGLSLIDCQQDTPHLRSMGARTIDRARFVEWLKKYCMERK